MIRLEQLGMSNIRSAAMFLVVKGEYPASHYEIDFNLMQNCNIVNCQMLKDAIDAGDPHFDKPFFKQVLDIVEKKLEKVNKTPDIEPITYVSTGYSNSGISGELLSKYDRCVNAADLLYVSPVSTYYKTRESLQKYSIYKLKEVLSLSSISSTISKPIENEFMILEPSMDRKGAPERIIRALEFYEAQTLRQVVESSNPECPRVFFDNEVEKRTLAEYQAKEFIEYLVENADITVWGEMTTTQKKKWLDVYRGRYEYQKQVRDNVERIITNYATLSELQKGVIESGAADRFILKPKGHL